MAKKKGTVLIVDDDEDVLVTARMILRPYYEVQTEISPKSLATLLSKIEPDVIILDMNFKTGATSGNEGLFWLRQIKKHSPNVEVVMNTAYGDIQLAVECMKEGATDFLVKPWEKEKLLSTIHNVFELNRSKKKISHLEETQKVLSKEIEAELGELVGKSPAIQKIYDTIKKVADTDANILILGENGTGKELVARAIHKLSQRKHKNFVKVDLGALTDSLFESELFGYVKGAFTDAKDDRLGRFEIANEGTLFLDEIGNISLNHQSKLLSVLQNRQISRVGDNKLIDIDIRLISATNKAIHNMADKEAFRQDLLYRINTIEIVLPPLRDRKGDIQLLTRHFLTFYANKYDKAVLSITDETLQKLNGYHWPGNVRELQHAVERAVIMSIGDRITEEDFLIQKVKRRDVEPSLKVEDIEKDTIQKALEKHNGNLTQAAQALGMGRSTLYRKMERYGI